MESFKQLAQEYNEKFETFQEELKKWEETPERIESTEFQRIQAEAEFPELKKEREDRERWARAERIRGDDERNMMARQHADEKIRLGVAQVPRLLTEEERKMDKFVERPGSVIIDMKRAHRQSILDHLEQWSPEERALFKSRQAEHVKIFHGLTEFFVDKSPSDLVLFYYMNKKTEDYKKDFKPKKRVTKYKVGAYPSTEELAYYRMMPPLDYSAYPKNSLMCYFCCQTVNGIELDGTLMPKEAYEIFAISPDEDRVVCSRCREEAAKLYKDNRCFGNRCSNQKKRANRVNRNIPLDFADFPIRTRAFLMDKIGSTRVAVKFCTPCKNALTRWINDINYKDELIMLELKNYEGQVGWTDQEKTKLVTLINASATLDWDAISAGMNRRPNECKMQYDALNGVKAQPLVEEVDEEDTGQEDAGDPITSQPALNAGARRSGLARNAKKAPRTPRVPRSTNRRTGGAITRAQANPKPVEDLGEEIDEMELEDNDEEASSGSNEKGSKAPSVRDGSPNEMMEADSPEGADQDVDEEEEEIVPRDIDSPVKTLLSPKILSGGLKPDFSSARLQPSTSQPPPEPMDTSKNVSDSEDDEENDALEIDLDEPPAKKPTTTSSSSQLSDSSSSGVHELGGRGLLQQQQQQAQIAAPPVTVTPAAAPADRRIDSTSPSPSVVTKFTPTTATSESVPTEVPVTQQPVVVISGAGPSPSIPQSVQSPVPIIQPVPQQLLSQRVATPTQILTPTPVRPTAASTPSMDPIFGLLKQQQPQQPQPQQLGAVNPNMLFMLLQQQQAQAHAQAQAQGSITSGTPFQAQPRYDMEAIQKLLASNGSTEMMNALINNKLQYSQFPTPQHNPLMMTPQQIVLQQQQLAAQLQQNSILQAQQAQVVQAQQAQAQAQQAHAQAQAQAQAQAKAHAAQAQAQAHQAQLKAAQAQAQYQMTRPQLIPSSVQMPIGINTAYGKSLTPSEPSASATPPAHRPRAATTSGVKTIRTGVQEAEHKKYRDELIKRIRTVRDKFVEESNLKLEEDTLVSYVDHANRLQQQPEVNNMLKARFEQLNAKRTTLAYEIDEPVKFIEGTLNQHPDLAVFNLDETDRQIVHQLVGRFSEHHILMKKLEQQHQMQQLQQQQKQQQQQQQQQQHPNNMSALNRNNVIGIRQPEYSALSQAQQVANHHQNRQTLQHQQHQYQLHQFQNQKRKLEEPTIKRIAPLSQAESAQVSPANTIVSGQPTQQFPHHSVGTNPQSLISYQRKTASEREKYIRDQQIPKITQYQALQQQQQHATQQEPKSKRKSGIESITSMQAAAPHRHAHLAGSSARIQGGRGVSPALPTSRAIAPTTAAGRSITAGTSGHAASSEPNNKELSERMMNQLVKPAHQQLSQAKANASNSNAVSPANTNNSDDIEVVWQGPAKSVPGAPTIRRLQAAEQPKSVAGQRLKKHLETPAHIQVSSIQPVKTEEEAMECLSLIMHEELTMPANERKVTTLIAMKETSAANSGAKFTYMDIFNEVVKGDEERLRRVIATNVDVENRARQQEIDNVHAMIQRVQQQQQQNIPNQQIMQFLQQYPQLFQILQQYPQMLQHINQNPQLLQNPILLQQQLQQLHLVQSHLQTMQQAQQAQQTQQSQQSQQVLQSQQLQQVQRSQPTQQAQQDQNAQQQEAKTDNYEKFHLLRPHEIARPIPTTATLYAQYLPKPITSTVQASSSAPQILQLPTTISTTIPVTATLAKPSPSIAVQTAPPTPQAASTVYGKPSSIGSNVSEVSWEDIDKKPIGKKIPPAPEDKTVYRSVVDWRATGHVPVMKKLPMKYPVVLIAPLKDIEINRDSACSYNKKLLYEPISDEE